MEHLAKNSSPQEIIPLILDRYAYIMKNHGKLDPFLVKVVEDGQQVDAQLKTTLCNLCFKQATHMFNKFNRIFCFHIVFLFLFIRASLRCRLLG